MSFSLFWRRWPFPFISVATVNAHDEVCDNDNNLPSAFDCFGSKTESNLQISLSLDVGLTPSKIIEYLNATTNSLLPFPSSLFNIFFH